MLLCRCAMGEVLTVPDARDTREAEDSRCLTIIIHIIQISSKYSYQVL